MWYGGDFAFQDFFFMYGKVICVSFSSSAKGKELTFFRGMGGWGEVECWILWYFLFVLQRDMLVLQTVSNLICTLYSNGCMQIVTTSANANVHPSYFASSSKLLPFPSTSTKSGQY